MRGTHEGPGNGRLCLVTGAGGAVGPVLIGTLLSQGYRVRAHVRRPVASAVFPEPVDVASGDLLDRDSMARAMASTNIVFHLAAKLHVPNPTEEMRPEYERVNVEGTRVVVEAAQAAGVERLVLFSTISVYGPTGSDPVDEFESPHPSNLYCETKLKSEQTALSAMNARGEPLSAVLRMAAIYGPRVKGNYASLVNALERGRFLPVGNGLNCRTLIYERDAARAAMLAATHPMAVGRVYNVSDGAVHTLREIIAAICQALGRRQPWPAVPARAARIAAGMADSALAMTGRTRRLAPAVDKLTESVAVRADRIQQELGFRPDYGLWEGWRETISTMRAMRRI